MQVDNKRQEITYHHMNKTEKNVTNPNYPIVQIKTVQINKALVMVLEIEICSSTKTMRKYSKPQDAIAAKTTSDIILKRSL